MNTNPPNKVFYPARRKGMLVMGIAAGLLVVACAMAFYLSYAATTGVEVIFWIALGTILVLPILLLGYRMYALGTASYEVRRESLRIRWGLRSEEIPTDDIEWVRPSSDLAFPLPLPRIWWPGALLGTRKVEGLGPVEFMASDPASLQLVAAPDIVFVISPENSGDFMRAFKQASELGSLESVQSQSIQPSFVLGKIWQDKPARWLVLAGLGLLLGLLVLVTAVIPTRSSINFGFTPSGAATLEPASPERLLLLPVLNALAWLGDLIAGAYFFRQPGRKMLAYLLWITAPVLSLMLFLAVWVILSK